MNLRNTLATVRGAFLIFFAIGLVSLAGAQTVWTGAQDSLFRNAANWSNGLPNANNAAVVPGGARVVFGRNLDAAFDLQAFGPIRILDTVTVLGDWQLSGGLEILRTRLNITGSVMNFGDATIAEGGSVWSSASGTFRSNGSVTTAGAIIWRGLVRNEGTIDILPMGTVTPFETGVLENPGVINVSGRLLIQRTADYTAPSGGTINVQADGRLINKTGGTITNAGIIRVADGGEFHQKAVFENVPGRTFVSGRLITYDGSETRSNFLTIERGGVLDVDKGELFEVVFSLVNSGEARFNRPVTVEGLVSNNARGSMAITPLGELDFVTGTDFTNDGSVTNRGRIRTVGTLTNNNVFVNDGDIAQDGNGSIVNNDRFTNQKLVTSIDRIVNEGTFDNFGRITNGSGGQIENNARFNNFKDAHIENLFEIFNRDFLVNSGFFENGVSLFNEGRFDNNGFLDNVGDIFNSPAGRIDNTAAGVIDNTDTGIFTNNGIVTNDGEINNGTCAVIANNNSIRNNKWINNEGIIYNDGSIAPRPVMGEGVLTEEGGTSPKICRPYEVALDPNGNSTIGATFFAAPRFDSCAGLQYLVNGEETIDVTCADLGTQDVTLTLRDRRGNEVSCRTTLTVVDDRQPKPDACPGDIELTVESAPAKVDFKAPTFRDNCDRDVEVTFNKKPGDLFPEGNTVVTYTARDDSGNEFVCEFTVRVTVEPPGCVPQDGEGLIAYYNFYRENPTWAVDRSGFGEPLHLKRETPNAVKKDGCGVTSTGHAFIRSTQPARKIADRVMMTRALTVEAWVRADRLQAGPARVVTFSENLTNRNFTLGQENDRWVFRLNTTATDNNGMPNRVGKAGSVKVGKLQHVVFTRTAGGTERLYVDGDVSYAGNVGGNFSTWGAHCKLALFDEMTRNREFRGGIQKIAIYDRALTAAEVRGVAARGVCCESDDSPRGQTCKGPRGQVTYEQYNNIPGGDLAWLFKTPKYPASPDVSRKLDKIDVPVNAAQDYGTRTRGWIYPKKSGHYQFNITGDDQTVFLFSTIADRPEFANPAARINGWTYRLELDKYPSQRSAVIELTAGKAYYFELLHKGGVGHNSATVFWKVPGKSTYDIVTKEFLGDVKTCPAPEPPVVACPSSPGNLLYQRFDGIASSDIWALLDDPRYPNQPTGATWIKAFESPVDNARDNYGDRVRGYIRPTETGIYEFNVTGDNQTKLLLSSDDRAENARMIAGLDGWTGVTEFNKFPSQKSGHIRLEAGKRYYVELLHQEGTGGDHFHVYWKTPSDKTYRVISGSVLEPYRNCNLPATVACRKDVLLVVGSTKLNNGDAALKRHFLSLGFQVEVKSAKDATLALARRKGLVYVSSTVNSGEIGTRFTDLEVPVITNEPYLFDDLKMTGPVANQDYGGVHARRLEIDGSVGALAAGLNGHVDVTTRETGLGWGKVMGSDAQIVAFQPGDRWRVHVFAYGEGARMAGGKQAPAIRAGFFFTDMGAALANANAKKLLTALLAYATNCDLSTSALRINPDLLDLEAARELETVKLVWASNTAWKNEYFTVERASAGGDYEIIGTVEARGEGDAIETFDYTDVAPALGENVYRVTAMFNDDTEATSKLRIVSFEERGSLTVYPNPATERFTISLDDFGDADVDLVITDPLGRTLLERVVEAGTTQIEVDAAAYAEGAYSVTVFNDGFVDSKIVVVTRD